MNQTPCGSLSCRAGDVLVDHTVSLGTGGELRLGQL